MTGAGEWGSAVLVLEDGGIFPGRAFGARGTAFGEAVFATGMTGYQETLTDPSYRRQVIIATAPQIGNTGWVAGDERASDDNESDRIQVSGFVIRDLSPRPSNWRSTTSLDEEMARQQVVGICEVDTRGLTRHLRSAGVMRCGIFSVGSAGGGSADAVPEAADMLAAVRNSPRMLGADLAGEVTTGRAYLVAATERKRFTVAAIDLGVKANTPQMLAARGIDCHVLPAGATIDDVLALGVDGVFLSNGPGDPATADAQVALTEAVLRRRIPFFGICFGNQILGRALGLDTYKLAFGHRGINQPVQDCATGRVLVTAHNHGFAVRAPQGVAAVTAAHPSGGVGTGTPHGGGVGTGAPSGEARATGAVSSRPDTRPASSSGGVALTADPESTDGSAAAVHGDGRSSFETPFGRARVAFTCLNDGVVEGLECLDVPAFSVQFHPEAAAGPHDAAYLFDRFIALMDAPAGHHGRPDTAAQRGESSASAGPTASPTAGQPAGSGRTAPHAGSQSSAPPSHSAPSTGGDGSASARNAVISETPMTKRTVA